MGEQEDKEKAEKLAAAKKRVEQLKKKKKAASGAGSKSKDKDGGEGDATVAGRAQAESESKERSDVAPSQEESVIEAATQSQTPAEPEEEEEDADAALFADAIKNANQDGFNLGADGDGQADVTPGHSTQAARKPSISAQSKLRSASFRQGETPTVISPAVEDGEVQDIYRKQIARIEELEKENRRLVEEARSRETRRQKVEAELEELREKSVEERTEQDGRNEKEVQRLRDEVEALKRRKSLSSSAAGSKSPDVDSKAVQLQQNLEVRESTISDLQLELSRLRSQLTDSTSHDEQVTALQTALSRAETNLTKAQNELADTKKALNRATEKAVVDSTSATSKETRIKELERTLTAVTVEKDEANKKVDSLNTKIEALNKVHRETEARSAGKLAAADSLNKELQAMKVRMEATEAELVRLREKHKKSMDGADASVDQDLDELQAESTRKLQTQIRELEAENFDLRRGVWRDRRQQLQPHLSEHDHDHEQPDGNRGLDTTDRFDDVDLNAGSSGITALPSSQQKHSNFTQVLSSGLAAFIAPPTSTNRARADSLLQDFDGEFDENAFATAQRKQEEDMKKMMVEHVREVKRGLEKWKGYRLDLVGVRRGVDGVDGFGEVFEV